MKIEQMLFINSFFEDDIIMIITQNEVAFFDNNLCENSMTLKKFRDLLSYDKMPEFYEEKIDDFLFY